MKGENPKVRLLQLDLILIEKLPKIFSLNLLKFKNCWTASTIDQREIGPESTEQEDSLHQLKKQIYSYSDVVRITNKFSTVVGKGGFGTVYLGYIDDTPVAVKMLSPSSVHGYRQFQAEVSYL